MVLAYAAELVAEPPPVAIVEPVDAA